MYLQISRAERRLLLALLLTQQVSARPTTYGLFASTLESSSRSLEKRYDRAAVVNDIGADWTVEVTIGGQKLNLLVDTGSSDTWVFSPEVQNPGNHTLYDWTKAPLTQKLTYQSNPESKPVQATFDVSYWDNVDSRVQGYMVQEPHVDIGAADTPMAIAVATSVGKGFKSSGGMDGILGLGFKELNRASPVQYPTFVEWLQYGVDKPTENVLTVDFNPNRGPPYKPTIEIGKINNQKFTGNLGHAPVDKKDGRWIVNDVAFEVNGKKINHTQQMNFDTGGAGSIQVELEVARGYYEAIGGKEHAGGHFSYPCSANTKLPGLTMHLGNSDALYPGSMIGTNSTGPEPGYCNGTLVGSGGNNVGAAFFKSHYVVFNYDEPAIMYGPFAV